jgi:hypothetical protein
MCINIYDICLDNSSPACGMLNCPPQMPSTYNQKKKSCSQCFILFQWLSWLTWISISDKIFLTRTMLLLILVVGVRRQRMSRRPPRAFDVKSSATPKTENWFQAKVTGDPKDHKVCPIQLLFFIPQTHLLLRVAGGLQDGPKRSDFSVSSHQHYFVRDIHIACLPQVPWLSNLSISSMLCVYNQTWWILDGNHVG